MSRPGYLNVKQAAERYGVSRAKLHRLIKAGRLDATKDPRDERATLLKEEQLEEIFTSSTGGRKSLVGSPHQKSVSELPEGAGRLTPELRTRIDELRERISAGRVFSDSVEIIRREREKRTRQLMRAVSGNHKKRSSKGN